MQLVLGVEIPAIKVSLMTWSASSPPKTPTAPAAPRLRNQRLNLSRIRFRKLTLPMLVWLSPWLVVSSPSAANVAIVSNVKLLVGWYLSLQAKAWGLFLCSSRSRLKNQPSVGSSVAASAGIFEMASKFPSDFCVTTRKHKAELR